MKTVRLFLTTQHPNDEQSTQQIGKTCGDGHPQYSKMEEHHKYQIQHRIQHSGCHQNIKRTARVAHTAQNSRPEIKNHDKGHAQKIHTQIHHRIGKYIGRSTHPRKNRTRSYPSQKKQKDTTDQSYQCHGIDRMADTLHILCSDMMGQNRTGSHRDADKQIDQQSDYRCITAHCCQSIAADKMAHHSHIDRIKQLL